MKYVMASNRLPSLVAAFFLSGSMRRVDVLSSRWSSKTKTINRELHLVLAALAGMMVAGEKPQQPNGEVLVSVLLSRLGVR